MTEQCPDDGRFLLMLFDVANSGRKSDLAGRQRQGLPSLTPGPVISGVITTSTHIVKLLKTEHMRWAYGRDTPRQVFRNIPC
ncbi:hypothetical protein J6590_043038 [Homalodisca vitripennis]|nr:hypothetical protein J6590_043038 [Homalodisca vitripennis]